MKIREVTCRGTHCVNSPVDDWWSASVQVKEGGCDIDILAIRFQSCRTVTCRIQNLPYELTVLGSEFRHAFVSIVHSYSWNKARQAITHVVHRMLCQRQGQWLSDEPGVGHRLGGQGTVHRLA